MRRRTTIQRGTVFSLSLFPSFGFTLVFIAFPIIYAIYLSLRQYSLLMGTDYFIGLKNYARIFTDAAFLASFFRTILYVVVVNSVNFLIAFPMALLVSQSGARLRSVLSVIFIMPLLLMPVVAATFWRLIMYGPPYAEFNRIFGLSTEFYLLASSKTAIWAIMLIDIWGWTPWVFLPILGGLEGLPGEVIEAAKLEGASLRTLVWRIILPMLKPVVVVTLGIKATGTFLIFDYIWAATRGGPGGTTHSLSTYIYTQAFQSLDYGYGSALAIVMLLCAVVLSTALFQYMRKE